jgi:hypothetical protein
MSQQTTSASSDQPISFSVRYLAFSSLNHNNSLEIDQLFSVESWASSWLPDGYVIPDYQKPPISEYSKVFEYEIKDLKLLKKRGSGGERALLVSPREAI